MIATANRSAARKALVRANRTNSRLPLVDWGTYRTPNLPDSAFNFAGTNTSLTEEHADLATLVRDAFGVERYCVRLPVGCKPTMTMAERLPNKRMRSYNPRTPVNPEWEPNPNLIVRDARFPGIPPHSTPQYGDESILKVARSVAGRILRRALNRRRTLPTNHYRTNPADYDDIVNWAMAGILTDPEQRYPVYYAALTRTHEHEQAHYIAMFRTGHHYARQQWRVWAGIKHNAPQVPNKADGGWELVSKAEVRDMIRQIDTRLTENEREAIRLWLWGDKRTLDSGIHLTRAKRKILKMTGGNLVKKR